MKELRALAVLMIAVLVVTVGVAALPLGAADHLDAPILQDGTQVSPGGDSRLDITDLYAFQSPADPGNVVFIMNVNPQAGILAADTFNPQASYEFNVDTDGDAKEEMVYRITFSEPDSLGAQEVAVRQGSANGVGRLIATGRSGEDIELSGGGKLRAGLFEDPFFVETGLFQGQGLRDSCRGKDKPLDHFAGFNVSAIVLEVPQSVLGTENIGVWARTAVGSNQVDRAGRPTINAIFFQAFNDLRDEFNEGVPKHDTRDFGEILPGIFAPDIMTLDLESEPGLLNGRPLEQDIIDDMLQLLTGLPLTDCIDANDATFRSEFPYLADAH